MSVEAGLVRITAAVSGPGPGRSRRLACRRQPVLSCITVAPVPKSARFPGATRALPQQIFRKANPPKVEKP